MAESLDGFLEQWRFIHSMTIAFVDEVPDEFWQFSPHQRFAPFNKQLRHVVCVRGVYNDAIRTGATDFARKHEQYEGNLSRPALRAALEVKQTDLLSLLSGSTGEDPAMPIQFFGRPFTLARYAHVMTQHEALHHGEWGLYAALAGFETPSFWRLNWGL